MTFHKAFPPATAPVNGSMVPAGTMEPIWAVFRTVRDAHEMLGLKSKVLATLAAILSCLKAGKGFVCFASNSELERRLGGTSEQTIRRHITDLAQAGLLIRRDSPNGKRYSTRDPETGCVEAYGLDVSPMLERADLWAEALQETEAERARLRHLRTLCLARLAWIENAADNASGSIDGAAIRKALRRKSLTSDKASELLTQLDAEVAILIPALADRDQDAGTERPIAAFGTSASAAQNERDLSMSLTEDKYEEDSEMAMTNTAGDMRAMLGKIRQGCSEALCFTQSPIETWSDVEREAAALAPMIGIDRLLMNRARANLGIERAAVAIFAMVQMQPRIRNTQAYFRSLISGRRSQGFDPFVLLDRLAASQSREFS